jgi:hypothetical protein
MYTFNVSTDGDKPQHQRVLSLRAPNVVISTGFPEHELLA